MTEDPRYTRAREALERDRPLHPAPILRDLERLSGRVKYWRDSECASLRHKLDDALHEVKRLSELADQL